jgi:hypothetical protein
MRRSALDAISVVDATLASLCIYIEILEVVIEVDRTCAEISPKNCSVCRKDGSDVDSALLAQREGDSSQPFVELRNNGSSLLVVGVLW